MDTARTLVFGEFREHGPFCASSRHPLSDPLAVDEVLLPFTAPDLVTGLIAVGALVDCLVRAPEQRLGFVDHRRWSFAFPVHRA